MGRARPLWAKLGVSELARCIWAQLHIGVYDLFYVYIA